MSNLSLKRMALLAFVGLIAGTGRLAGQSAPTADPPNINPGSYVRARLGPDHSISGRYVPVGDGRLGIRNDAGNVDTLRLAEVGQLAVRGRHTRTGAIVGGIAGVAFGAFVAFVANGLCDYADCRSAEPYLIAIPAFGAGGTLLGAAIGSAFPKWKRVFP